MHCQRLGSAPWPSESVGTKTYLHPAATGTETSGTKQQKALKHQEKSSVVRSQCPNSNGTCTWAPGDSRALQCLRPRLNRKSPIAGSQGNNLVIPNAELVVRVAVLPWEARLPSSGICCQKQPSHQLMLLQVRR